MLNCPLRVYWKNNIKKKHPHAIQTETWKKQEKLRKQEIMLRPVITRLKMAWQKTLQISNTQYCPLKRCVEASCISLRTRKHQKLEAYSNDKFTHRWPNEKKTAADSSCCFWTPLREEPLHVPIPINFQQSLKPQPANLPQPGSHALQQNTFHSRTTVHSCTLKSACASAGPTKESK